MYKKIKNSSFMNIFWFILYLLPLVMIIVFSINFYRNDEINVNENPIIYNINNYIDNDNIVNNLPGNVIYNSNNNYYTFTDGDNYIEFEIGDFGNIDLNIYRYFYIFIYNGDGSSCDIYVNSDEYMKTFYQNYLIFDLGGFYVDYDVDFIHTGIWILEDTQVYFLLTDCIFNAEFLYNNYYINGDVNNISYDVQLSNSPTYDYATYLQDNFYNTFSHTGIIYNMFINLFSYFGVLNIYIKIISVYLEYIILISLIHLAVDILLLLPNICHKFMERIGGERD